MKEKGDKRSTRERKTEREVKIKQADSRTLEIEDRPRYSTAADGWLEMEVTDPTVSSSQDRRDQPSEKRSLNDPNDEDAMPQKSQ